MKITPIRPKADLDKVEEVIRLAFSETSDSNIDDWFSLEEMSNSIKSGVGACFKAFESGDKIVGIVHGQQENPINGREGIEKWIVTNIAVIPNRTGQGIGGKLLNAIESEAVKNGATKIYTHTNKGDSKVINFYKKYGYSDAGYVDHYYYDSSAVFLIKVLK